MKKKSIGKTIGIVVGALIIGGFLVNGIVSKLMNANKLPEVATYKVGQEDLQTYIDGSGMVESRKMKTYFSPVNGKINAIDARLGDNVKGGTHIIGFDLTNLEKNNQKAMLGARASSLSAADAIAKANEADGKVATAASELAWYRDAVEKQQKYVNDLLRYQEQESQPEVPEVDMEKINELTQEIAEKETELLETKENQSKAIATKEKLSYEIELAKAQNDNAKVGTLVGEQSAAIDEEARLKQEVVKLEMTLSELRADLSAAQSAGAPTPGKPSVETTIALNEAQAELAKLQGELNSREAIVDNASTTMTSAAREQLQVDTNLRELEAKDIQSLIEEGKKGIHTDFTGIISDFKVVNGMDVVQGQELFTVTGLDDVIVKLNVNKSDLTKLKVGQDADLTIAGKAYKGKVEAISKIAIKNEKGGSLIPVTVKVTNADEDMYIGVDAKVRIIGQKVDKALSIPKEALNISQEGNFVYLLKDGEIVKQMVEEGMSTNTKVEIKSGLKLGDEVITNLNGLEVGMQAKAQDANEMDKMPIIKDEK